MATVTPPLRIGPADSGRTMTLQEFLDADVVEGYRYELARGVLEVNQVANDPHRQVVTNLYDSVGHYRRLHPGRILAYGGGNEFQFIIPGLASGRNPDLGVVLRGARRDWRGRRMAALAAEVVSRGSVEPRLRDQTRGVPGLRPGRILDRRSARAEGHGVDSPRRYLGRGGLPR